MTAISNLPVLTTATDDIIFPVVDIAASPDTTKQSTFGQLKSFLESSVSVRSVAGRAGDVTLAYTDVSGLSALAHSGSYSDIIGKPNTFPVSTATVSALGGVKVGSGISVTTDGTISVNYSVPVATNSVLGGVKIGSGIDVTMDGTISTVPMTTASATVLGGIKVGSGLTINESGVLSAGVLSSANLEANILYLNVASTGSSVGGSNLAGIAIQRGTNPANTVGIVYSDDYYVGNGSTIARGIFGFTVGSSGSVGILTSAIRVSTGTSELNVFGVENPTSVMSVKGTTNYELQVTHDDHIPNKRFVDIATSTVASVISSTYATTSTAGVIKIGSGLTVTNGIVSATVATFVLNTATASVLGGVKIGTGITIESDGTISATTATPYTLPIASTGTLGGVKVGSGIALAGDGTISVTITPLQTATNLVLGGVKIGGGLAAAGDGTISVTAAFIGGVVPNITQFTNTTASTSTMTGAVQVAGGVGIQGNVNLGNNLTVASTVTAASFVYTGASTPEVYSASNLNLSAVGRVQVTQSPFKVWTISSATRATITASNGDIIYNTDVHRFQGYANGVWKDMTA